MTEDIKNILTNTEIIAINQDPLGEQGHKIKRTFIDLPPDYQPALYESELEIMNCSEVIEQKWYINSDDSIRNNNENLCMEIPNCVEYDTKVKTSSCHIKDKSYCSESKNQEWIYNKTKCLDIYNQTGPSVQTYNCSDHQSQIWEYNETTHTLMTNGKCLSSLISYEVTEVWKSNLSDGAFAILLVNRASFNASIEFTFEEIGIKNKRAKIRDLWDKKDLGEFEDKYSVDLEKHDSQFLKIWEVEDDDDDDKIMIIVLIVAGSVIVVSIILLVLAFYFRMKKWKVQDNNDNIDNFDDDKLIESRETDREIKN